LLCKAVTQVKKNIAFLMIVSDPEIARYVNENGVDKLFVDLETMGKEARQPGHVSWKSSHSLKDAENVRAAAPEAHLLVRVNPLHTGTGDEVAAVIDTGANSIMLPMFHSADELTRFYDIVNDRVEIVPLIETHGALISTPQIAKTLPLKTVHFGLNDLHLELGYKFMFEVISRGDLEEACAALKDRDVLFGIGGLARAREGIVSPEYLLGEHVRLGSSAAILSRTFHRSSESLLEMKQNMDFAHEVAQLRAIYDDFHTKDAAGLERNRKLTVDRVNDLVQLLEKS